MSATTLEIALDLQVTPDAVRARARAHGIKGRKIGNTVLWTAHQREKLLKPAHSCGRPKRSEAKRDTKFQPCQYARRDVEDLILACSALSPFRSKLLRAFHSLHESGCPGHVPGAYDLPDYRWDALPCIGPATAKLMAAAVRKWKLSA